MKKSQGLILCLLSLFMSSAAEAEDTPSGVMPAGEGTALFPAGGKTITIDPGRFGDGTALSASDIDTALSDAPDRKSLDQKKEELKRHRQDSKAYNEAILKNWPKEFNRDEKSYYAVYSHVSNQKAVIFKLMDAMTPADKPGEEKLAAARGVDFYARMTAYEYHVDLSRLSMLNAHTYKIPAELNGSRFMIFVSKMEGDPFYLRIFAIGDKVSYEDITILTTDFFDTVNRIEKGSSLSGK